MASEAPPFWWQPPDWRAYALYPISAVYGDGRRRRMSTRQARADRRSGAVRRQFHGRRRRQDAGGDRARPGGEAHAAVAGLPVARFRRQFPGAARASTLHHDSARHVGDEPLLLAEHAPVAVTPDRAAGAKLLASRGCDFLIMDDGFQSARIHMDYALLVVDGRRGVGNGHVIPGGPVRAPLVHQMRFAQAVLKIGDGEAADDIVRMASRAGRPVYEAHTEIRDPGRFAGRRFLAFAGIGDPEKFFDTVAQAGGAVEMTPQLSRPSFLHPGRSRRPLDRRRAKRGWSWSPPPRTRCGCGTAPRTNETFAAGLERARDRLVFDIARHAARHHRGHARRNGATAATARPTSGMSDEIGQTLMLGTAAPSPGAAPDRSRSRASARRWR